MNILIAIDSFKGSLTSAEAGEAAAAGVRLAIPSAVTAVRPLADGGEGTVDALVSAGGEYRYVSVSDPLGRRIRCRYGLCRTGGDMTAVIEMSAAAGLTLIPPSERNPLYTTTYGVGEIIADAVRLGVRSFIIGIGGSATNDGGAGMLSALGFGLYSRDGAIRSGTIRSGTIRIGTIRSGAIGLASLAGIECGGAMPELAECSFRVACDVKNPLCGESGCSAVFAPQKGADAAMVADMDCWLKSFAELTKKSFPDADPDFPGSGAAGGLGFALRTYLGAKLESGVSLILDALRIEDDIASADIVVTGEGRIDAQTAMGKAPSGVALLAKKHGKPCIALSGCIGDGARSCNDCIDAYFPVLQRVCGADEALAAENARANVTATAEQVFRLISRLR